ncbi:response regulator [Pseudosulfitobacter sp. DSM 107133]|jgi:two-component system phosphate regulon response regulator OmpR|uniref:response regulator n=1 Tax=Pseudosulfitobacter sp. DSM 107133 TaxID=2883100 RepID=UPI000DF24768|nr:response regulator [Pseudosulfitobacter sp. DSM 107133]UOA28216.1 Transcriptional regulatory protein OmpR [Pseudosulfitobacter sp. DSM 107133]
MTRQILLVEDDPAVRHLIVQFLTRAGANVHEADSLEQARQILRDRADIDLAILDFWLGKDTAVGLMDDLRNDLKGLPILIISGGNTATDLETTQAIADISGAVAFLQKPFRKNDLLEAVETALS